MPYFVGRGCGGFMDSVLYVSGGWGMHSMLCVSGGWRDGLHALLVSGGWGRWTAYFNVSVEAGGNFHALLCLLPCVRHGRDI